MTSEGSDDQDRSKTDEKRDALRRQAQNLAGRVTTGVLGTVDEKGFPYTSLVEVVFDGRDSFWLLLSELAVHTRNLGRDERASLFLRDDADGDKTPLASPRATYLGEVARSETGRQEIGERYLQIHPQAEKYIEFSDFDFYRLKVEKVRLVAGFGQMGWVAGEEFGSFGDDK